MPVADRLTAALEETLALSLGLAAQLRRHLEHLDLGPQQRLVERHLADVSRHGDGLHRRLRELGVVSPAALAGGTAADAADEPLGMAADLAAAAARQLVADHALEVVALAAGDRETAELARRQRRVAEQLLEDLRELVPVLARASI